jgi:hypothetical protein
VVANRAIVYGPVAAAITVIYAVIVVCRAIVGTGDRPTVFRPSARRRRRRSRSNRSGGATRSPTGSSTDRARRTTLATFTERPTTPRSLMSCRG